MADIKLDAVSADLTQPKWPRNSTALLCATNHCSWQVRTGFCFVNFDYFSLQRTRVSTLLKWYTTEMDSWACHCSFWLAEHTLKPLLWWLNPCAVFHAWDRTYWERDRETLQRAADNKGKLALEIDLKITCPLPMQSHLLAFEGSL